MKANDIDGDNHNVRNIELEVAEHECLMCVTFLGWLREAWPEDKLAELPAFQPRDRMPVVKIHGDQSDFMPFCEACAHVYMAALAQFHREKQAREGQEPTELQARVRQGIVTPPRQIVLPGQPGFRA